MKKTDSIVAFERTLVSHDGDKYKLLYDWCRNETITHRQFAHLVKHLQKWEQIQLDRDTF